MAGCLVCSSDPEFDPYRPLLTLIQKLIAHDPKYGAYTEAFAGLQPDITQDKSGSWGRCFMQSFVVLCDSDIDHTVAPFGRFVPIREDLLDPSLGKKYWDWTEEQVKVYM
jgi:hypothetical protein